MPRAGEDHGFVLIEVLVSALILILASVAILTALEKSDALAGNQQKRTIAANVAQSELERVRSLPIEDIANLRATTTGQSTTTLNGVKYTIQTGTKWLSDGRDTVDCTANNGGLDYLQATTTVTWPSMGNAKPIKMSSLVSPSNKSTSAGSGSLSVQLVNAANVGLANVPVSLTGTSNSFNDSTDDNGCVAWGDLDATDPWELQFSIAGYVDANGNSAIDDTIPLAGGATTTRQYLYDKAGYITANFKSRVALLTDVPGGAYSQNVVISNSQMTSDKNITFANQTKKWDSNANNTPLFPFASSPYTVYAGTCASNRPPSVSLDILQAPSVVNVTSGVNQGVNVYEPALNVTVKSSAGVPVSGAMITVTDPCGAVYKPVNNTSNSSGQFNQEDWGYPYFASGGTICASLGGRKAIVTGVTNSDFSQATNKTVTLPAAVTGGSC